MGLKKLLLFSFLLIKFARSIDNNGASACGPEMKTYVECIIKARKLNSPQSPNVISRKELEDGLNTCFTSNECQKPTLDDHSVPNEVLFVNQNANNNLYGECYKSMRTLSKSNLETCINRNMTGFSFYDDVEPEKPQNDMSASLVASFWIYSISSQMHNSTVCPGTAKLDLIKKCCSDQFAKVFPCHNPFNDLQDSANRFEAACNASQECSNKLSANCKQNYDNSIAFVKNCVRNQLETEKVKKEMGNKFLTCMKKENSSNFMLEPKMAEFQAEMSISHWTEAMPQTADNNCTKSSFWEQFQPQPWMNKGPVGRPGHMDMMSGAPPKDGRVPPPQPPGGIVPPGIPKSGPIVAESVRVAGGPVPPPPPPPPPPAGGSPRTSKSDFYTNSNAVPAKGKSQEEKAASAAAGSAKEKTVAAASTKEKIAVVPKDKGAKRRR